MLVVCGEFKSNRSVNNIVDINSQILQQQPNKTCFPSAAGERKGSSAVSVFWVDFNTRMGQKKRRQECVIALTCPVEDSPSFITRVYPVYIDSGIGLEDFDHLVDTALLHREVKTRRMYWKTIHQGNIFFCREL